jgi:prepilin-type processing-associated H-X9-DG protein
MNRTGAAESYRVRYLRRTEIPKSPSKIIEFTDLEPRWEWGAVSCRLNYNFSNYIEDYANTTHNARPNLGYLDGHVERKGRRDVGLMTEVYYW